MARDYKNAQPAKRKSTRKKTSRKTSAKKSSSSRAQATNGIPRWVVFLAGIAATLVILWAKDNLIKNEVIVEKRDLTPFSQRAENSLNEVSNDTDQLPKENVNSKEVKKDFEFKKDPRFTFYERLPNDEIIIPQEALEIEVDKNDDKEPLEKIAKAGSYVLQAGSFQEFTDADRRKAELALLGLESAIQKVSIDKRNWYRVRIGPYTDLTQLNATRQRLRDGSVDALVIRTK